MKAPSGGDTPAASQNPRTALRSPLHKQQNNSHRFDALCTSSDESGARKPHLHQPAAPSPLRLLDAVHSLLGALTGWLLVRFAGIQDAALAISWIRALVSWALLPRCHAMVLARVIPPACNTATFDTINYHVSEEAQKLLLHGSLHSLVGASEALESLPAVGRILLQTGSKQPTDELQAAVAEALAGRLGASLLVVDDTLLREVCKAALGGDVLEGGDCGGSFVAMLLSFIVTGGRAAFVWDILTRIAASREAVPGPLVMLVPNVEVTLCGSFERWAAFQGAMGRRTLAGRPFVLLGGCGLGDTAAQAATPAGGAAAAMAGGALAAGSEDEKRTEPTGYSPPGQDDALAGLLPLAAELGLSLGDERPDPRKVLPLLFQTRVRLQPPTDSAAAAKYADQLQKDAASSGVAANHAVLAGLAADRRSEEGPRGCSIGVPPASAAIFQEHRLSPNDWAKVLAWAVGLEAARKSAAAALAAQSASPPASPNASSPVAGALAQLDAVSAPLRSTIRRCMSATQLGSALLGPDCGHVTRASLATSTEGASARSGPPAAPGSLSSLLDRLTGSFSAEATPCSPSAGSGHCTELVVPGEAQCLIPGPGGDSEAVSGGEGAPAVALEEPLQVSEGALRYGLQMLQRSGGALRPQIVIDNSYERRLLAEVISPEASGNGFKDVGALVRAKDALREAVQLPLQHPRLFSRGALARPCKGVLLFGPPGTGKTLLARAAAAECGASFLAISPSTLASKWFGDGVRYVRALFSLAAKLSPCVVFIDEVDALLGKRNSHSEHEALREMKNELMAQWDGIRSATTATAPRVMVLGATNRPGDLDEAVLRRFSRRLFCDLPDLPARQAILQVILEEEELHSDVSIADIAATTGGFSGSDLRQLCVAAAMRPIRELLAASGKSGKAKAKGKREETQAGASPDLPSSRRQSDKSGQSDPIQAVAADVPAFGSPGPAAEGSSVFGEDDSPTTSHNRQQLVVRTAVEAVDGSEAQEQRRLLTALLEECDAAVAAAAADEPMALRALVAEDFRAAQRDVAPSVAPDGSVMENLRAWNNQYGEGGSRNGWDAKLTYFM